MAVLTSKRSRWGARKMNAWMTLPVANPYLRNSTAGDETPKEDLLGDGEEQDRQIIAEGAGLPVTHVQVGRVCDGPAGDHPQRHVGERQEDDSDRDG